MAGRVASELYFLDKLLKAFPKHSSSAPMFTYAVRIGEDEGGILTEDFTRGGTRCLTEFNERFGSFVHRQDLPEGLYRDTFDALDGQVYAEAFGHMLGFVFDKEVLIDFNDVAYPEDSALEPYRLLVDSMTLVLEK